MCGNDLTGNALGANVSGCSNMGRGVAISTALLAVTSFVLFEPVTTIPALLQAKAPPHALIGDRLDIA
jgi:hypothetical protein